LAEEFEKQNPVYVAGKSSYDLLRTMLPLLPCEELPVPSLRYDRTPDFWVGWVLAHYQMVTGCSYRSIFATATYDEIRSMYWPLHEAPRASSSPFSTRCAPSARGPLTSACCGRQPASPSRSWRR
ncbi:hypothetical protein, partial [Adlercreutzia sp. DFI.6.23]|uniref:hypothetical protein n=1 Tax=Adlercreutzia sp. DFI.6.23 TaxID=2963705 RepID=UPI0021089669